MSPCDPSRRVRFGAIRFDNVSMAEAIDRIDRLIARRVPASVITPNVDHVVRACQDDQYASLVKRGDLVLVDGQPIVWASYLMGRPLKERVAGSDLLPKLCEHAARVGYRVFLLGGDPGAADQARATLRLRYPLLQIVGTYCPPLGFEHHEFLNREVVTTIRRAHPDILFVGLGSPKQEQWIDGNRKHYHVPVSIGVGISFSFMSGQVERAPSWMRRLSLEWLHRLCKEPRRLWRRYLVRGQAFFPLLATELWRARVSEPLVARRRVASNPLPTTR